MLKETFGFSHPATNAPAEGLLEGEERLHVGKERSGESVGVNAVDFDEQPIGTFDLQLRSKRFLCCPASNGNARFF